jgi:hypothetical protein
MASRSAFAGLPITRSLTFPFILSLVTAILLSVTSTLGLMLGRQSLYRPDPRTLPAFIGQDAITLAIGLPLLLGSLWTARRGSLRGLLVWMASLFYFAYGYAYYLLSPEFNSLYLAYIAIVSLSAYSLLYLLLSVDAETVRARFTTRTPTRLAGGFLVLMALLMTTKWVTSIIAALTNGPAPTQVELGVWPMDLVIAFPAMFWGGVWLWRRQALGYLVGTVLLAKAAAVGLTLVVATWLVTLWGAAPDPMVPVYAAVGLGGVALSVVFLRSIRPIGDRHRATQSMSLEV